jgi:hypothetical protein
LPPGIKPRLRVPLGWSTDRDFNEESFDCQLNAVHLTDTISPFTFEEIDRTAQASPSTAEVKEYSQRVEEPGCGGVQLLLALYRTEAFILPTISFPSTSSLTYRRDAAFSLRKGQVVSFIGTIGQVSEIDTAPPMVHIYVVLNHVQLQSDQVKPYVAAMLPSRAHRPLATPVFGSGVDRCDSGFISKQRKAATHQPSPISAKAPLKLPVCF